MYHTNTQPRLSGRPRRGPRHDPRRPGDGSRLTPEFQATLMALAELRSEYETVRSTDGSFEQRARLLMELHEVRAQMSVLTAQNRDLT